MSFHTTISIEGSELAIGQFQSPHDVAFDSKNQLYVADYWRIQKINITSTDGKAKLFDSQHYDAPAGIAIDSNDIVMVTCMFLIMFQEHTSYHVFIMFHSALRKGRMIIF